MFRLPSGGDGGHLTCGMNMMRGKLIVFRHNVQNSSTMPGFDAAPGGVFESDKAPNDVRYLISRRPRSGRCTRTRKQWRDTSFTKGGRRSKSNGQTGGFATESNADRKRSKADWAADNNQMAEAMLPLELGGRRAARVAVAQRELEIREFALENQERLLASEVRLKFGEALAAIKKLEVTEKTLAAAKQGFELVAARVTEGKIAPLEQNIFLVEVNRLQSIRETAEGKAETAMFELRNMIGMKPEDPLRLRGDFNNLIATPPSVSGSTDYALRERPDLQGARTMDQLAVAQIEKAKSEGRIDASVKAGYQRMNTGFMLSGFDDRGLLRPIQDVFHFFTFGVEIDLPLLNRNQGAVEAAKFEREAAQRRIEFGELTIRREVAVAFARYNRAARSLSIFQNGVRDQANSNLQVIWQTYELGSRSLLDYIAEQRRFLDVENELIDAGLETYIANIEIMRATNAPELKKK